MNYGGDGGGYKWKGTLFSSSSYFPFLPPSRFKLYAGHFLYRVEAGTGFYRVQVVMSYDQCPRKQGAQFVQQGEQGGFLGQRAGVRGLAVGGQSAFVADAHGVSVVVLAVRTRLFQRSAAVDFAVAGDVEMVADVAETAVADVIRAAGFEIQAPPLGGGGAVEDEECNGSHGITRRRLNRRRPLWRWLR